MSDEQTALVRVQKNELVLAERKVDGQIARAKKAKRIGQRIGLGGAGVMAAGVVGTLLVPHVALGIWLAGCAGVVGGGIKNEIGDWRYTRAQRRRSEIDSQRKRMERDLLWRLEMAATAALRERGIDGLAAGQELRLDFEDEAPKLLCVTGTDTVHTPPEDGHPYHHRRIYFAIYETEPGPDGGLTRTGAELRVSSWDFDLPEPPFQPAEPEKILPFTTRACEPVSPPSRPDARPEPQKKLPPCTRGLI